LPLETPLDLRRSAALVSCAGVYHHALRSRCLGEAKGTESCSAAACGQRSRGRQLLRLGIRLLCRLQICALSEARCRAAASRFGEGCWRLLSAERISGTRAYRLFHCADTASSDGLRFGRAVRTAPFSPRRALVCSSSPIATHRSAIDRPTYN